MSAHQEDEGEGQRRLCQACFRIKAQHRCQVCHRLVCDGCVAPAREVESESGPEAGDFLERFLQAAMTRCRACRHDDIDLPDNELHIEGG